MLVAIKYAQLRSKLGDDERIQNEFRGEINFPCRVGFPSQKVFRNEIFGNPVKVFCNCAQLVFVTVFNVTTVTGPSMAQVKKMTEIELLETGFLGTFNISFSFAFLSKLLKFAKLTIHRNSLSLWIIMAFMAFVSQLVRACFLSDSLLSVLFRSGAFPVSS